MLQVVAFVAGAQEASIQRGRVEAWENLAATGISRFGKRLAGPAVPPPAVITAPPAPAKVNGGAPMSMLGDIGRAIAPAVTSYFGLGSELGTQIARISASQGVIAQPGTGGVTPVMASLPRIAGALGGIAGTAVGAVTLGARTIYRSASIYCRRHPAWCAQIGGTAAIASMIQGGTLPPIRRRRARGISSSEFKGFRKVHKVLSGFCAPRMRVRKAR
jgi:hypothetical protein